MQNSANISTVNKRPTSYIEASIEKLFKLTGSEAQELSQNQLIIAKEDSNLIELDIIIDICSKEP